MSHTTKIERNNSRAILIHNSDWSGAVKVSMVRTYPGDLEVEEFTEIELPGWVFQEIAINMVLAALEDARHFDIKNFIRKMIVT